MDFGKSNQIKKEGRVLRMLRGARPSVFDHHSSP